MEGSDAKETYDRLLSKYLRFYMDLHERRRRPKSAAQRQFQDVAWGVSEPSTTHEKAYVYYLENIGRPPRRNTSLLPTHFQPNPLEFGKKWDDAADNMSKWKPWHD